MNQTVLPETLARVPTVDLLMKPRWSLAAEPLVTYLAQLVRGLQRWANDLTNVANTGVQGVGPDLASATSITPSAFLHHVTGTTTIDTIEAPAGFSSLLVLIADGAWSLGTAGNIAVARSPSVGDALFLVYDPREAVWHPN